jgi:hypothetical protein
MLACSRRGVRVHCVLTCGNAWHVSQFVTVCHSVSLRVMCDNIWQHVVTVSAARAIGPHLYPHLAIQGKKVLVGFFAGGPQLPLHHGELRDACGGRRLRLSHKTSTQHAWMIGWDEHEIATPSIQCAVGGATRSRQGNEEVRNGAQASTLRGRRWGASVAPNRRRHGQHRRCKSTHKRARARAKAPPPPPAYQ